MSVVLRGRLLRGRPKINKYHNKKCSMDGFKFDSLREMAHYEKLKMGLKMGLIKNLQIHPVFPLVVNGVIIGKYISDFSYRTVVGTLVVVDVKGVKTAVYKLKKRLIKALYSIDVVEV